MRWVLGAIGFGFFFFGFWCVLLYFLPLIFGGEDGVCNQIHLVIVPDFQSENAENLGIKTWSVDRLSFIGQMVSESAK